MDRTYIKTLHIPLKMKHIHTLNQHFFFFILLCNHFLLCPSRKKSQSSTCSLRSSVYFQRIYYLFIHIIYTYWNDEYEKKRWAHQIILYFFLWKIFWLKTFSQLLEALRQNTVFFFMQSHRASLALANWFWSSVCCTFIVIPSFIQCFIPLHQPKKNYTASLFNFSSKMLKGRRAKKKRKPGMKCTVFLIILQHQSDILKRKVYKSNAANSLLWYGKQVHIEKLMQSNASNTMASYQHDKELILGVYITILSNKGF